MQDFFKNITQSRIMTYILTLGVIPLFISGYIYLNNSEKISLLKNELSYVEQIATKSEKKNRLNLSVRDNFADYNKRYIDDNIEKFIPLQNEINALNKIVNNKFFAGDETVRKRLEFLTGKNNSIILNEGAIETYPYFKEVLLSLSRPVEVGLEDIKQILALIEGQQIGLYTPAEGRPQLIITEFKIDKKDVSTDNQVFSLNMRILKREYEAEQ